MKNPQDSICFHLRQLRLVNIMYHVYCDRWCLQKLTTVYAPINQMLIVYTDYIDNTAFKLSVETYINMLFCIGSMEMLFFFVTLLD